MRDELIYIGEQIVKHKSDIAQKLVQYQESDYVSKLNFSNVKSEQILEWRLELIHMIGTTLDENKANNLNNIRIWAERVGGIALENGIPLNDSMKTLSAFRTAIWDIFIEEINNQKISSATMFLANKKINPLLDEIGNVFNELFVKQQKDQLALVHSAMDQLSAPIVPIAEKVAVLPLIGEIDTHRASSIMETVLKRSGDFQLDYLFIDISGVAIMDTMVSHNIYQIIQALKMMGVTSVLTGIRPEVAHTLGNLGITFEDLKTSSSLKQALEDFGFNQYKVEIPI
ncbi:STAS domain-containing protein [Rossellomorea aquimaris]|uniref:STAS domain-containing protein n=1 Tax=Rossellomorea aquimaris TaxID=189382 RepID=UPI0007D08F38|nr:STAS domain-containing protein [Rossellomorea aquimaris]